jgi:hypothetical protein
MGLVGGDEVMDGEGGCESAYHDGLRWIRWTG